MHLWKYLTALAAGLLALSAAAQAQAQAQVPEVEEYLDTAMPASRAPGMAYAVVESGNIRSGARGERLLNSGLEVTPDTPFLLGSISKSFTALAIMQLVETGKLELDDPVSQYLPSFSDRPSAVITIRQLLSHTSGFSTVQGNSWHADGADNDGALASEVDAISKLALAATPGSTFDYSNANYRVLGRVIEVVSGMDYAAYVEREILDPLEMENSFVSIGRDTPQTARAHRPWFLTKQPYYPDVTDTANAPAGGVIASANDLALYLAMMLNGEDDIISAASKAVMLRPAGGAAPFYGFGWNVINNGETAYHTGTSPGVETLASMLPAQQMGVVVLVNAGSGFGIGETEMLTGGVAATAFGLDYQDSGGRLSRLGLFALVTALPFVFVICMIWAWRHRAALRAKSGAAGLFSLWFPLVTTSAMAWCLLVLMPSLFGTTLSGLLRYLPDMVLLMIAGSIAALGWALLRLGLAYGGKRAAG